MSEEDIFGELDSRTKDASGGDFADWWEPEDQGEELIGVIVEMHSAPEAWTDPGEVPDEIHTVVSVGRGDVEEGKAVTPKQHKQLKRGLDDAGLMDLVKLRFTGYQKVDGQPSPMNTYDIGVIPEEEWREYSGADEIAAIVEAYDGQTGDNRRTEPYTSGGGDDGSGDDGGSAPDSRVGEAASALKEVLSIQNGSIDRGKAEKIITEIREYDDVDFDEVLLVAGVEDDDGVIREA